MSRNAMAWEGVGGILPEEVSRAVAPWAALGRQSWPNLTAATTLLADAMAIVLATAAALLIESAWTEGWPQRRELLACWPWLVFLLTVYWGMGAYPGVGLVAARELRLLTRATTLGFLLLGAGVLLLSDNPASSRGMMVLAWLLALATVPAGRGIVRWMFGQRTWWGYPVVVMGRRCVCRQVIRLLQAQPALGLRPAVVLTDELAGGSAIRRVPVVRGMDQAQRVSRAVGIHYAILAMPEAARSELLRMIDQECRVFRRVLIVPDFLDFSTLWVQARDMGGMLALEVRQHLLEPMPRRIKRLMDLLLVTAGMVVVLPLGLLLAALIKLDSRGPVLYRHRVIGRQGVAFDMFKFRTMVANANDVLHETLSSNRELRQEWEVTRKLRADPRVTRVGRWLRRLSLDELPQFINVMLGQMSLVGPRPFPESERAKRGDQMDVYCRAVPGITGMWQACGRNELTYRERMRLDAYYVRNWSVWLDVVILIRTVGILLDRRGAY
ncbi:MAG: undecaprenyl-phosphate galactose phosphotransferase WbaP [Phycisphaeraceae bacterium]|nr:undecaprenyl-phosphate galactose phosphotransferase WbaP [Phycisphaeraceae bacterium]